MKNTTNTNKTQLNENTLENVLLAVGFIPVIGEVADIISIIRYCWRKEWVYAGLMVISLIPTVGDVVAKPILWAIKKLGPAGRAALKSSDEAVRLLNARNFAASKGEMAKIAKLTEHSMVKKLTIQLNKISPKLGGMITKSMDELKAVVTKVAPRTTGIAKNIGKELVAGSAKPVSKAIKGYFRDSRAAKYALTHGVQPSSFISKWYNNVLARKDRRAYFKRVIIANNILDLFGFPTLRKSQGEVDKAFGDFENKLKTDERFREDLANSPEFSKVVEQTTTPEELAKLTQPSGSQDASGSAGTSAATVFGNMSGPQKLALLKQIAQMIP